MFCSTYNMTAVIIWRANISGWMNRNKTPQKTRNFEKINPPLISSHAVTRDLSVYHYWDLSKELNGIIWILNVRCQQFSTRPTLYTTLADRRVKKKTRLKHYCIRVCQTLFENFGRKINSSVLICAQQNIPCRKIGSGSHKKILAVLKRKMYKKCSTNMF